MISFSKLQANIPSESCSGFKGMNVMAHEQRLIAVGIILASSLRRSAREEGVPGVGDFLNGILLAGLMLERAVQGDFIEVSSDAIDGREGVLSSRSYREMKDEIAVHVLAEVAGDRATQSHVVAQSAEGVVMQIAADMDIQGVDILRLVGYAVVSIVCAVSKTETRVRNLSAALDVLREKKAAGQVVLDMSEGVLFGAFS